VRHSLECYVDFQAFTAKVISRAGVTPCTRPAPLSSRQHGGQIAELRFDFGSVPTHSSFSRSANECSTSGDQSSGELR
jgi:hypothetical protein